MLSGWGDAENVQRYIASNGSGTGTTVPRGYPNRAKRKKNKNKNKSRYFGTQKRPFDSVRQH